VAASSYVGNPLFGSGGASDPHDIAVVLFAQPLTGITPARLPTARLLDQLKAWLPLSMNPSTGNGGTCYGDSGGPHFLGGLDSDLIASITITGDAWCRASDKTDRVDTPAARDFLDDYVALP